MQSRNHKQLSFAKPNLGNDESCGHKIDNSEEDNLLKIKSNKLEDQLNVLQKSSELNRSEVLLNDLFNQKRKFLKKSEQKLGKSDELNDVKDKLRIELDSEQQISEQSDNEETISEEKQQSNDNLSNILQLMQKHNGNSAVDLSGDEEEPFEEDEESISEEERFAQFQQLLLSSTSSSAQQPSTSTNKATLSMYEELISQQSINSNNQSDHSVTLDDEQQDSEISDYERFSRALQQHHLLQQFKQDQLSSNTSRLTQQQLLNNRSKRSASSIYTKLYQCNICEYNTRWLSNLYVF